MIQPTNDSKYFKGPVALYPFPHISGSLLGDTTGIEKGMTLKGYWWHVNDFIIN